MAVGWRQCCGVGAGGRAWGRARAPDNPPCPTSRLQPDRPFLFAVEDPNDPDNDLGRNSYNISRARGGAGGPGMGGRWERLGRNSRASRLEQGTAGAGREWEWRGAQQSLQHQRRACGLGGCAGAPAPAEPAACSSASRVLRVHKQARRRPSARPSLLPADPRLPTHPSLPPAGAHGL